ncbi:alpha/beta fold family hydrolase [Mucor ambiguus]|uniref:Alpha/beta fold family hydrolase n=1 Tax=Mucor ambiguus TaxID=91626 RepID=A0A0C9MAW7_9FUNG|nr:alpha/beta fold family hydrolase [Mucor ambiguus]
MRAYSSKAVNVSFDKYALKPSQEPPVLICHGLFGSKQNWTSLAKAMSNRLSRDVYTIDLRNHGDSPHTTEHTYNAMTEDLKTFIDQQNLKNPILLGHSMGGKAVMNTALACPDLVSKLIVVDMPPVAMQLARNFSNYVTAMKAIEEANPSKQSEADKILSQYESNVGVRMFLLTNLKRMSDGALRFRIPYDILGKSLDNIGGFHVPENAFYKGETLFIAGGESPYLQPFHEQEKQIKQLFPNSKLEVVEGAGHWVHAEKPDAVLNLITSFVLGQ